MVSFPFATEPFISLDDVSLRLYGSILFEHTCWKILSDQHWAVVGANGSGKSTLAKAICGQVPVVRGKITYHFAAGDHRKIQEHIAYVSFDAQKAVLRRENPYHQARWHGGESENAFSVAQYLSENHIKGMHPYQVIEEPHDAASFTAERARVTEWLEIEALLDKKVAQLSNGERRKVLIARALLKNPRLLILDNPLTGLDIDFQARLGEIIERLMGDEMRVMVVTARRDEILPGITHVLAVEDHQVIAQGPRNAILNGSSVHSIMDLERPNGPAWALPPGRQPEKREGDCPILVHMDNVHVSYNGSQILRQIHWTVRRGEHWALLGANGSGKTTLLSLILGDNPQAYANSITLFGRRRGSGESIWEIKKHIGWVSSELHLYHPKEVSCFDVVCSGFFDSIGLYRRCSSQQREAARSWMQHLGVWKTAHKTFGEVSEGEQRMILLARALVKRPTLLILDEPCLGLDAAHRDRIVQTVDAIGNHLDASVIYVTHRAHELPKIMTHVLRLDRGRIVGKARISQ